MLYLLLLFNIIIHVYAFEEDITVEVDAGKMDCFFQPVTKPGSVEVEYQVIDGGDLDINFFIQGTDGRILVSEQRKSDNFHRLDVDKPGDLKLCLDNTFSHFAHKMVFFEIISDDDDDDDDPAGRWDGAAEELQEIVDMQLDDFKNMLDRMGQNLDKSRNTQTVLKMYEARDRNIVESNFDRVNLFSFIQLAIMLSVGLVQVFMIRHLFDDKGRASGLKTRT